MRTLLLSDIHANIDALLAVAADVERRGETFDAVWVLGDLVDYGAMPAEVIAWVQAHATHVVRGNHDHALGTGTDCHSAPAYHPLAVESRRHFSGVLSRSERTYLATLPMHVAVDVDQRDGVLVHATPRDALFDYVPTDSSDDVWRHALGPARSTAYVFLGHTHDPFTRRVDRTLVVNPGSVGMPKDGDPRAEYAVLDQGAVELRRCAYDTERAAARIEALPIADDVRQKLAYVIRHAALP